MCACLAPRSVSARRRRPGAREPRRFPACRQGRHDADPAPVRRLVRPCGDACPCSTKDEDSRSPNHRFRRCGEGAQSSGTEQQQRRGHRDQREDDGAEPGDELEPRAAYAGAAAGAAQADREGGDPALGEHAAIAAHRASAARTRSGRGATAQRAPHHRWIAVGREAGHRRQPTGNARAMAAPRSARPAGARLARSPNARTARSPTRNRAASRGLAPAPGLLERRA